MVYYINSLKMYNKSDVPMAAGIDWLTIRYPSSILPTVSKATVQGEARLEKPIAPAYFMKKAYEYANGVRIYGDVGEEYRVQVLDGHTLTKLYREQFKLSTWLGQMLQAGANITRLDLCFDLYDKGEHAINELLAWKDGKRSEKRRKVKLVYQPDDVNDGVTIYEGSRASDVFMKLYDKNVESRGQFPTSRFECELKGDVAKAITAVLLNAVNGGSTRDIGRALLAHLLNVVEASAVACQFASLTTMLLNLDLPHVHLDIAEKTTSTERWILEQVIPVLKRNVSDTGTREGSWYGMVLEIMEAFIVGDPVGAKKVPVNARIHAFSRGQSIVEGDGTT